jgi:hypothetical protein
MFLLENLYPSSLSSVAGGVGVGSSICGAGTLDIASAAEPYCARAFF